MALVDSGTDYITARRGRREAVEEGKELLAVHYFVLQQRLGHLGKAILARGENFARLA